MKDYYVTCWTETGEYLKGPYTLEMAEYEFELSIKNALSRKTILLLKCVGKAQGSLTHYIEDDPE